MTFRKTPPPKKRDSFLGMLKSNEPIYLPGRGPSQRSIRNACQGLERLVGAGTPVKEAIDITAQGSRGRIATALGTISEELENGNTLYDAVSAVPGLFNVAELQLISAAEKRGAFAAAFGTISTGIETKLALRRQLISSSLYPSFILVASFFLAPLPELVMGSTKVYMGLVMGKLSILLAVVIGLGFLVPLALRKTDLGVRGRRLLWVIPWPGSVYRNHVRGRFAAMFATNIDAGFTAKDAIHVAAAVTVDPLTIERSAQTIKAIEGGSGFADGMIQSGLFPAKDKMSLVAGERSGELVETLQGIAKEYDEQRDRGVRILMKVFSSLITFIAFFVAASGIMDTFAKGTSEIYDMVDQEMPYDTR